MAQNSFRITVLISGAGSNLASLIKNARNYTISSVFSDNPEALGLTIAADAGITPRPFSRSEYPDKETFRDAIMRAVEEENADLIALAGFMRVVPEWFVKAHFGKVINIHPSLLPKFPGLHTHERVLEAGEKFHGCTVHYVDAGVDTGPIIAQARAEVLPDEDADSLGTRIRNTLEHRIYAWVVNHIAAGNLELNGRTVIANDICSREAQEMGFYLGGERAQ